MENKYYTINDIQILTGLNRYQASRLISNINGILKIKYKELKNITCKNRVLKDYFIKWREL